MKLQPRPDDPRWPEDDPDPNDPERDDTASQMLAWALALGAICVMCWLMFIGAVAVVAGL